MTCLACKCSPRRPIISPRSDFDKVRVAISVDQSRAHRPKLQLAIIEPALPRA